MIERVCAGEIVGTLFLPRGSEVNSPVRAIAESCKRASRALASSTPERRIAAIRAAAELIEQNRAKLLESQCARSGRRSPHARRR